MKYALCVSFLFFLIHPIVSIPYLYPVAACHNDSTILFIQQKNRDNVQLLTWDSQTGQMQEALWSLFKPGNIHILPDETGFSFIDNGRLRIQYFNRRSPKTIDFDYSFYGFNTMQWLNNSEFCCSAQMAENHYALFHCAIDGSCCCIAYAKMRNYLYPQKIAFDLFYIEEEYMANMPERTYHVMQCPYPDFAKSSQENATAAKATQIFDGGEHPIAFLTMISDSEGFFVGHPPLVSLYDTNVLFTYYHIQKRENQWVVTILFTFSLPVYLFDSKDDGCLHESLLPLIPRIIKNKICFVDCSHATTNELEFFHYDLESGIIEKNDHIFRNCFVPVPLYGQQMLVFGGVTSQSHLEQISFLT